MKKLCKYPVKKWKDIPYATRERIREELAVPLPEHLKRVPSTLKFREKKNPFPIHIFLAWTGLIILIIFFLFLLLN
jgi:hypothetical protein